MKVPLPPGRSAIVRLDLIDPNPKQPRKFFAPEPLEKLKANIAVSGVFHSIYIEPNPEKPGRYLVVAGERRFRSLKALEVEEYEFRIVENGLPPYIISIIENSHRENLNPIEEAESYEEFLKQEGMSVEKLCAYNGKHYTEIYRALRLLKLAPEVKQLVREGKLNKGRLQDLVQNKSFSKQIELAQQLVRGEDPPELVEAETQTSKWREDRIRARLPETPEGLIRRILQFSGRAYRIGFAIDAFLKMSEADQVKGWNYFTRATRENFVARMITSAEKTQVLNRKMAVLPETRRVPSGAAAVSILASAATQKPQDDKKKPAVASVYKTFPVRVAPAVSKPVPVPGVRRGSLSPAVIRAPSTEAISSRPARRDEDKEPFPEPKKPTLKLTTPDFVAGQKVLEFISEAVQKNSSVLLSKAALGKAVGNGSSPSEAQKMVIAGFRAVREVWRSPLQLGDPPEKQGFVELVSNCRHDMGNLQFYDLMRRLRQHDKSEDPINVDAL